MIEEIILRASSPYGRCRRPARVREQAGGRPPSSTAPLSANRCIAVSTAARERGGFSAKCEVNDKALLRDMLAGDQCLLDERTENGRLVGFIWCLGRVLRVGGGHGSTVDVVRNPVPDRDRDHITADVGLRQDRARQVCHPGGWSRDR